MSPRMGEDLNLALALEGRAAAHGETKALVAIAEQLAALPEPEIDPAFAAALEAQLLTDGLETAPVVGRPQLTIVKPAPAPAQAEPERRAPVVQMPSRRFTIRRSLVAAATAASLTAFPVVAAAKSLPGSPFYGLKDSARKVQLALFGGKVADGFTLMQHAATRVDEAAQLAAFPTPRQDLVADTLDKATNDMARAKGYILDGTNDAASLSRLASMARETAGEAASIGGLGTAAREAQAALVAVSQGIQREVEQRLGIAPAATAQAPSIAGPTTLGGSGTVTAPASDGSGTQPGGRTGDGSDKNRPGGARKYIKDAQETGCKTIGGAQFGDTLADASTAVCKAMEGAARI